MAWTPTKKSKVSVGQWNKWGSGMQTRHAKRYGWGATPKGASYKQGVNPNVVAKQKGQTLEGKTLPGQFQKWSKGMQAAYVRRHGKKPKA